MSDQKWNTLRAVPILIVSDIEQAVTFYQTIGFEETFRNDVVYSVLRLGNHFMHLAAREAIEGAGKSLALIEIEAVDDYYAYCIAQSATIQREIDDQFYGLRSFVLADPDGNTIEFAEPITKESKE